MDKWRPFVQISLSTQFQSGRPSYKNGTIQSPKANKSNGPTGLLRSRLTFTRMAQLNLNPKPLGVLRLIWCKIYINEVCIIVS